MEQNHRILFVFSGNSHGDSVLFKQATTHLLLEAQKAGLKLFHRSLLKPGMSLSVCRQLLLAAPVAVVLLSANLLADQDELPLLTEAVTRSQGGALCLIPVLASDVVLSGTPVDGLQVLFGDFPLSRRPNLDEALVTLAGAVRKAIELSPPRCDVISPSILPEVFEMPQSPSPLLNLPLDRRVLKAAIRKEVKTDDRLADFLSPDFDSSRPHDPPFLG